PLLRFPVPAGAKRAHPEREVIRGDDVDRSADGPGANERLLDPERVPHVLLRHTGDARRKGELGGREELGLETAHVADGIDEPCLRHRRHEVTAREAPLARVGPRQLGQVDGTGSISQSRCSQTTREYRHTNGTIARKRTSATTSATRTSHPVPSHTATTSNASTGIPSA